MLKTLFSPSGRIAPGTFQSAAIILIVLGFILGILPLVSFSLAMVGSLLGIVLIWPWIMILIKRARDAGKSGWFCLVAIGALLVLSFIVSMVVSTMFSGDMAADMENIGSSGDMSDIIEMTQAMAKKTALPSAIANAVVSAVIAFVYNAILKRDGDNQHGPA